jgi:hypothetical protein
MRDLRLEDHPSTYTFETDGKTIALHDGAGNVIDLVKFRRGPVPGSEPRRRSLRGP